MIEAFDRRVAATGRVVASVHAGEACVAFTLLKRRPLHSYAIQTTSGFEGAMVHERCHARGDDHCFWRAAEAGGYE